MTNDATPFFQDGDTVTCRASGAITGKRFVKITGARADGLITVSPSTAGANVFGVAARDTADTGNVMVYRPGSGILPVTASGALTAGQAVKSDATGKAIVAAAGEAAAGIVCDDAADGTDALIDLRPHIADGAVATAVVGDQPAIAQIATADATDLASAEALANAIKAKVNTLLTELGAAGAGILA